MAAEPAEDLDPGTISSTLLGDVRANSADGWSRMVLLYAPLVLYWCQRRGLQAADADDVLQEVFRAVARRVGAFQRRKPGAFRAWLRGIARHKISDLYRQRREAGEAPGEHHVDQQPAHEPLDEAAERSREEQILYARVIELARSEFEERTWTAFYRVVVAEEAPAEVAAALGMSVNAVYLAKSRVLRWARDELAHPMG